ncbi:hypothetical protein OWR29_45880 [Actinoplanes sp. Pm04-4]|uniref:Uncharacterized protein n=1 Tax=Paractinoplanes pyxinae TaxID=2997416 RepID=A0ABT4BIG2_9ACTN|nr:hypothetical protein [Actinoplanes pyxinae]MCY1145378.1 hypothetical protein [Actinoplanes pyxinae]
MEGRSALVRGGGERAGRCPVVVRPGAGAGRPGTGTISGTLTNAAWAGDVGGFDMTTTVADEVNHFAVTAS